MRISIARALPYLLLGTQATADALSVLQDLIDVESGITQFNNHVNFLTPGIIGLAVAIQISEDSVLIDDAILKATSTVQSTGPLNAAESSLVVDRVVTIAEKSKQGLATIKTKKESFGDLVPIVQSGLLQVRQDNGYLGLALYPKLDSTQTDRAIKAFIDLTAALNSAIDVYNS